MKEVVLHPRSLMPLLSLLASYGGGSDTVDVAVPISDVPRSLSQH